MRDTWIKIVISVSAIIVIICIVLVIYVVKPISIKKETIDSKTIETTKYNFEAKLEDLHLEKEEDYLEYLNEILDIMEPKELQKLVVIDVNRAGRFKNSDRLRSFNGNQNLSVLYEIAYEELLCRVIRHGEDWSELPLTEHFREKFNPEEGVITHPDYVYYDDLYTYVNDYSFNKKEFAVECKNNEGIRYGQVYTFILNEEGYLDDIIFLRNDYEGWEYIDY